MRIEIDKQTGLRTQYADENKWLYQELMPNCRHFTGYVLLGKGAEPWPECTDGQRKEWEEKHREQIIE